MEAEAEAGEIESTAETEAGKAAGQFRPKRGHQISDPVVSVSFWSKPLSWTTCDALWPILAFYSHFVDIFGPRVGF